MKYALILIACFFSAQAMSDTQSESMNNQSGVYISPCDNWNYNNEARGYVCWMRPRSIHVPTSRDLESVVVDLQSKIDDLQRQIDELRLEKNID